MIAVAIDALAVNVAGYFFFIFTGTHCSFVNKSIFFAGIRWNKNFFRWFVAVVIRCSRVALNAITLVCAVTVVMQPCASIKAVSGLFRVRHFIVRQSGSAVSQCRYRSDELQLNPNIQSPERTKAVTSFYFQPAIDQAAAKVSGVWQLWSCILPVSTLMSCDSFG